MKRSFQYPLLTWYQQNKRDLPWRRTRDPYRILLSEVMLQQTQVATVIPYYDRFLKAFPTLPALARAPLDRVLKLWEGLGYYSRARNLHALANAVTNDGGQLPAQYDELLRLPGIGRYTAGAILSIAFNKDFPVVDGNVMRVLARYFGIRQDITHPDTQKKFWKLAQDLIVKGQAGDFNQAMMELGATLCVPQNPNCPACPLRRTCFARRKNLQNELPVKKKKAPIPHKQIGAGVIFRGDEILIAQRPLEGLLGGLWEFPGGKIERGETSAACVRREILEELGVKVRVGDELMAVDHAYSHFKVTIHFHECRFVSGQPKAIGCHAWRWVKRGDLKTLAFPTANQPVLRLLERAAPSRGKARSARVDAL